MAKDKKSLKTAKKCLECANECKMYDCEILVCPDFKEVKNTKS